MNKTELKKRIAQLIGKNFFAFGSYKTKDGADFSIHGEKMEVGMPVYIVTPQGEIPVGEGEYEMENGMKIKVKEGAITNIEDGLNTEGTPIDEIASGDGESDDLNGDTFDEAELTDGTLIGTDGDFEVGKKLYVKDQEGNWVNAPVGEHTTKSGIVLTVDEEGFITGMKKPDEAGEGSLEDMSSEDLLEVFTAAVNELRAEVNALRAQNNEMTEKFNRFSALPAGEKISTHKSLVNELNENKFSKLETLASIKNARK
jgi:hypothetical protein